MGIRIHRNDTMKKKKCEGFLQKAPQVLYWLVESGESLCYHVNFLLFCWLFLVFSFLSQCNCSVIVFDLRYAVNHTYADLNINNFVGFGSLFCHILPGLLTRPVYVFGQKTPFLLNFLHWYRFHPVPYDSGCTKTIVRTNFISFFHFHVIFCAIFPN